MSARRSTTVAIGAAAFMVAALLAGAAIGPVSIHPADVAATLGSKLPWLGITTDLDPTLQVIVLDLRVPRVILAALVGGMLAVAGGAYQGVFRNPLADPYLLGVAAGAGLAATLVIAYGPSGASTSKLLPAAAFAGASLSVALTYLVGRAAGRGTSSLILAGVTVAAFLTAAQTFFQQQRSETLRDVYAWLLGQLQTAGWEDVLMVLPYAVVSSAVIFAHRRLLDVLRLGDDEAAALGVDVRRVRATVIAAATVGTAAAVAVSGLIGFVGIIVPHTVRLLAGGSYRVVLPVSIVAGAGFLVLADTLARTVLAPAELPIGVVTAIFGAPFFAMVLRTSRMVSP